MKLKDINQNKLYERVPYTDNTIWVTIHIYDNNQCYKKINHMDYGMKLFAVWRQIPSQ